MHRIWNRIDFAFGSAWQNFWRNAAVSIASVLIVWVVLLALGSLLLVLHSLDRRSTPRALDLEDVPIWRTEAITDSGNRVALFHFKMYSTAAEIEQFIAINEKDLTQIIRLTEPNSAANLHTP